MLQAITILVLALATLLNAAAIALTVWRYRKIGGIAIEGFHSVASVLEKHQDQIDMLASEDNFQ